MKRAFLLVALTLSAACASVQPTWATIAPLAIAHTVFGTDVPLQPQPNAIAITWAEDAIALHSLAQLPDALQADLAELGLVPQSVGTRQAILQSASGEAISPAAIATLETHGAIAAVHSIKSAPAGLGPASDGMGGSVIVPDELLVQIDPSLSDASRQLLWQRVGVEEVRPLRFTEGAYLVSADQVDMDVMAIAQQLKTQSGVLAAEPNFVQATALSATPPTAAAIVPETTSGQRFQSADLARAAWHLDSTFLRGVLQPRTDIRAIEAQAISQQGAGVTVAVIDSTLQLNHPNLAGALACPELAASVALEGETCGWDFIQDDPQTALSPEETEILRFDLHNSLQLSDRELLETYADFAAWLSHLPPAEQADIIRQYLQHRVQATFHGTWSAGVIAARPQDGLGLSGVAPQASILPVRVFDLDGTTTTAALIEATGYAAARGADVINLSLGGLLPSEALVYHLFALMDQYPEVAIVASAGNSNLDGVSFPAAIPGVISVGATTLEGHRAPYSQYGGQLDLVAPGGDTQQSALGGILTTGGTWLPELWEGVALPDQPWGVGFDPLGTYVQVQGTSFAAPNVAGVVALMKGENPELSRDAVFQILQETASPEALSLTAADKMHYRLQKELGFGTVLVFPVVRNSGIYEQRKPISAEQYYFGVGLVNAVKAVEVVQQQ